MIASWRLLPLSLPQVFEDKGLFIWAGQPGWLGSRDLTSPLFSSEKFRFFQKISRAAPVTEISDFATYILVMGMN